MSESTPQAQPESDVEIVEEVPPSPAPFGVLESREPSPALTSSPTTPSLESTPAPAPPAAAAPASPAPPTPSAPTPSAPRPATPAPTPSRPTAPRPTALKRPAPQSGPPVRRTDPSKYGRIDAEGTVWLRTPAGDVVVGQWAAGTAEEGLAFFGRKYDDLLVEVDLAAYRLREGRGLDTAPTAVAHAREALAAPSFLGDVDELGQHV